MSARAPVTIWLFLLLELLKLLVIAASVVVVVGAFAVSIRFLANGTLGPLDALRLMALASIPMLQYALPFAGGFAATLAYHRMSQENELTACYAGGLSHRSLLTPAAILGCTLGIGLFLMADQVMPKLFRKMEELVTDDATRLLQAAIGRGQAIERGNQLIYADKLIDLPADPASGAYKHFQLQGVVAVDLDKERRVVRELAAPLALVWLFHDTTQAGEAQPGAGGPRQEVTRVVMRLKDPLATRGQTTIAQAEQTEIRFVLPSAFSDDPKFLTFSQLAQAKAQPEALNLVANPKRQLAVLLAQRVAAEQIGQDLAQRGAVALTDPSGRPVIIRAAGVEKTPGPTGLALIPVPSSIPRSAPGTKAGTIEVSISPGPQRTRTYKAERAFLAPTKGTEATGTTFNLVLENVTTTTTPSTSSPATVDADELAGTLTELTISALQPAIDPLPDLAALRVDALLAQARARTTAGPSNKADPLPQATARLADAVQDLRFEITSKQHERVAASLACVVMVLLGGVMGMKLGNATPLIVYLWSFLPAVGAIVSISAGQSLTHTYGPIGLLVIYAGVLLLAGYTLAQFRIVAKH